MAAIIERQSLGIALKGVGSAANVPSDAISKLMYYLSCVNGVLPESKQVPQRLTAYQSGSQYLSTEERALIVRLCKALSPEALQKAKCFFLVGSDHNLLKGCSNAFVSVNLVHQRAVLGLLPQEDALIAARNQREMEVDKIMLHNVSWSTTYYWNPLRSLDGVSGSSCVIL